MWRLAWPRCESLPRSVDVVAFFVLGPDLVVVLTASLRIFDRYSGCVKNLAPLRINWGQSDLGFSTRPPVTQGADWFFLGWWGRIHLTINQWGDNNGTVDMVKYILLHRCNGLACEVVQYPKHGISKARKGRPRPQTWISLLGPRILGIRELGRGGGKEVGNSKSKLGMVEKTWTASENLKYINHLLTIHYCQ